MNKSILIPIRFKETVGNEYRTSTLTSNQLKIIDLEREETNLQRKLDYLLFQNINKSKSYYLLSEKDIHVFE